MISNSFECNQDRRVWRVLRRRAQLRRLHGHLLPRLRVRTAEARPSRRLEGELGAGSGGPAAFVDQVRQTFSCNSFTLCYSACFSGNVYMFSPSNGH